MCKGNPSFEKNVKNEDSEVEKHLDTCNRYYIIDYEHTNRYYINHESYKKKVKWNLQESSDEKRLKNIINDNQETSWKQNRQTHISLDFNREEGLQAQLVN